MHHFTFLALLLLLVCIGAEVLFYSDGARHKRHARAVNLVLCFFFPLFVYLCCLAPGLAGDDTAEYALRSYTLGLAHGAGYPFYIALGKLFTLPFGTNVVYGLNVMSALFSAAAVAILSLIIMKSGCGERLACYLSLHFAFVPAFWSQAVMAEVNNVGTAAGLALIWLALSWHLRFRSMIPCVVVGALAGLSTGIHFLLITLAPGLLLFVMFSQNESLGRRVIRGAGFGAGFVSTLSLVLIITVTMARNDPPLGTIHIPVDLPSLFCAITGKENAIPLRGLLQLLIRFGKFLCHYSVALLGISFLAALLGVVVTVKDRNRAKGFMLAAVILCNAVYAYVSGVRKPQFMTNLSYACFAVLAGHGYRFLILEWPKVAVGIRRVVLVLPALALFLFYNFHEKWVPFVPWGSNVDLRAERRFDDFADGVLEWAPRDAIVFSYWCQFTSIRYKQAVKDARHDIQAFGVFDGLWYGHMQIPSWRGYVRESYKKRPVFVSVRDSQIEEFADLVPAGNSLLRVVARRVTDP